MVEIREETDDNAGQSSSGAQPQHQPNNNMTLTEFLKQDLLYTICSVLRILTIFFTFLYLLTILGICDYKSAYYKALASAAATFAFRLHQRLRSYNVPTFSRDFVGRIFLEDSSHYLLYCISFVSSSPLTMALCPIALYAALHTASFLVKLGPYVGYSPELVAKIARLQEEYTPTCLQTIACAEIFIFPAFLAMILMGKASFMLIFLYYRFLALRYASQRNPNTRLAFHQLKISLLDVASRPQCPGFVRQTILSCVQFTERLGANVVAQ